MKRRYRRHGFTLMEVLLVLAILVILGSLVGFFFTKMQTRGYEDSARIQINSFELPLNKYKLDTGSYPSSLEALRNPPSDLRNQNKWDGPYLEEDVPLDPWDNPYQYELFDDGFGNQVPRVWSLGADAADGTEDDVMSRPTQ